MTVELGAVGPRRSWKDPRNLGFLQVPQPPPTTEIIGNLGWDTGTVEDIILVNDRSFKSIDIESRLHIRLNFSTHDGRTNQR